MRDLLIAGILLVVLPFALRNTWVGVLLWNWISLMNPHKLAYGFVFDAPIAAVAGGAALVSLVIGKDKLRMPSDPPVIALALFVFWMCITTLLAIDPAGSVDQLIKVLKIQLMVFVAFAAIQSRKHIELFIWVCVLSIGFYGLKGGIFTLMTGGGARVWGPPGGFIEDNNNLGVALVITIPFLNYLRMVSRRAFLRYGLLGLTLLCAVAALGTQSRGALLSIAAMSGFLWMRSRQKVLVGMTLTVVALNLLAFMPAEWEERMNTIQTFESDGSAMSRLDSWKMCFNLANDRPIGGGFGVYTPENYAKYNPNSAVTAAHGSTVAHSIYFSVLAEHGWVGLFIYVMLGVMTYRLASRIRKDTQKVPEAAWANNLAGMCQVSLIGFAVGGSFLSLAYFDLPYNIIVVLVALRRWVNLKGWEQESSGPFGAGNPIGDKALAASRMPQVAK